MVRLLAHLSNFEPVQIKVKINRGQGRHKRAPSRADLHKRRTRLHKQLVKRYQAGETVKTLAAEHNLHHGTVRAVLVEAGVEIRTRRRLTDAQVAHARDMYLAGFTTTEIGEVLGVYASTVGRALIKAGVRLRPAGSHKIDCP